MPSLPPSQILKFIHVLWLDEGYEAEDSARYIGGAGDGATDRLIGTPPPLPRGAFVSFPFVWYLVLSLPFDDRSEIEAEPPPEDCGGRESVE